MTKSMKRIRNVRMRWMHDQDADASYLEQAGFEDRYNQYRNDVFTFVGCEAKAEIAIPYMSEGKGGRTYFATQQISSGGLWGIESDSDAEYKAEIEKEQLQMLRVQLKHLGFSTRAISAAFRDVREGN